MINRKGDVDDARRSRRLGDRLGERDRGGFDPGNAHRRRVHGVEAVEIGVQRQVRLVRDGADEGLAGLELAGDVLGVRECGRRVRRAEQRVVARPLGDIAVRDRA